APASASSTELSTTSWTRWCSPRSPVEPMYIPGRLRTASRPSKTVIERASYDKAEAPPGTGGHRADAIPPCDGPGAHPYFTWANHLAQPLATSPRGVATRRYPWGHARRAPAIPPGGAERWPDRAP